MSSTASTNNTSSLNEMDAQFLKQNSFGFGHLANATFDNFNTNMSQLTSQNIFLNANFGLNNNSSNTSMLGQNANNTSLYSEAGSERSDTPSSCVTTASSLSCFMAPSSLSSSFTKNYNFDENLIGDAALHKEDNLHIIGSSSTSTSSTVSDSNVNSAKAASMSTTPTKESKEKSAKQQESGEKSASPGLGNLKSISNFKNNKLELADSSVEITLHSIIKAFL